MSKKIAVTGGSGKLGRACIDALLEEGWTPFNFDLVAPRERTCSFTRLDLGDYGQVVEALAGIDELHDGVDAVLHLAAIPNVMDEADYAEFPSFEDDPASRKWNLWSYIDARDGAQAAVKALAYDQPGFDAFVIAADDTVMSTPSAELMAEFFPGVEFRAEVPGTAALCSLEKAQRLLGWTPSHHWRDHADAP